MQGYDTRLLLSLQVMPLRMGEAVFTEDLRGMGKELLRVLFHRVLRGVEGLKRYL